MVDAARQRGLLLTVPEDSAEVAGSRVRGRVEGHTVWVGQLPWLADGVDRSWAAPVRRRSEREGRATAFVRVDDAIVGALVLDDPLRPEAPETVRRLRREGFRRVVTLIGDHDDVARGVGAMMGVDEDPLSTGRSEASTPPAR